MLVTPTHTVNNRLTIHISDLVCMFLAPFVAIVIRWINIPGFNFSPEVDLNQNIEYAVITFLISIPIFIFFKVHDSDIINLSARDIFSICSAVTFSTIASIASVFSVTRLDGIPRTIPILYGFVLLGVMVSYRIILKTYLEYSQDQLSSDVSMKQVDNNKKIIIIGLDEFSRKVIQLLELQKPRTTQVVTVIPLDDNSTTSFTPRFSLVENPTKFGSFIDEYQVHGITIDEVWLSDQYQYSMNSLVNSLVMDCDKRNVQFLTISEALNLTSLSSTYSTNLFTLLDDDLLINEYLRYKRIFDLLFLPFLALILIPLFPVLCLISLLDVGMPIFFWQIRSGWRGKKFQLYKFRTLRRPIGDNGDILNDTARMSYVGNCLRKSRLDETPQLLSVISGDMSFIGPRPLLPRDEPKDNVRRLAIRPGITGWAQVNGNNLLSPEERNFLDCWYIDHASLFLDVKILFMTIFTIIYGVKRNEAAINQAAEHKN